MFGKGQQSFGQLSIVIEVDTLARQKRIWLHAANLSFVFAFAVTLCILGWFAMK
jgi:hypothetical protein